ncbi:MAG: helix-turn-helix domain-containing protein [Acidimicrobiia bacterium]
MASTRFAWRLEERMHERGIHQITGLQRELVTHGIDLSSSQIHRLVTQTPERLNLEVLAALCEILACSPADLVEVHANARRRRAADAANVVDMATTLRPRRARVTRPTDKG